MPALGLKTGLFKMWHDMCASIVILWILQVGVLCHGRLATNRGREQHCSASVSSPAQGSRGTCALNGTCRRTTNEKQTN